MITEDQFLKDVAAHEMIVLRDEGAYRHIRFKKPGTGCMRFDLVTWPGYLAYGGDMGCYVFSRLEDMFEFFRTDRRDFNHNPNGLSINLGYWSEKLQAVDGNRSAKGAKVYSPDKFRAAVWGQFMQWAREAGRKFTKEQRREIWEETKSEVLADEADEHATYGAANGFFWRADGKPRYEGLPPKRNCADFEFVDLWDYDFTEYTPRFIWCCYALAWGIQQYDNSKQEQANGSTQ